MFTLKLYRGRESKVIATDHVRTVRLGKELRLLEVFAHPTAQPFPYEVFYVGEKDPDMTGVNDDNHWGWGLLENWEGNTSEHYRPAGYGLDYDPRFTGRTNVLEEVAA